MEDSFQIPVIYKGQEVEFEAQLVTYGYSHRFHVDIDGANVLFEPDEERNYRAMLSNEAIQMQLKPDTEVVKLVGMKIKDLFGR